MTHPAFALRKAIVARLSTDSALIALGVADRVYEEPTRGVDPPFVVFTDGTLRDLSTTGPASAGANAAEHGLSLHIWSREPGAAQIFAIAERVRALLHEASLTLDGHRLINLRLDGEELRRSGRERVGDGRDAARGTRRLSLRLRAVTETL